MDSVKALVFSGRVQEGMCATWVLPGGSLGEGECSVTSVEPAGKAAVSARSQCRQSKQPFLP